MNIEIANRLVQLRKKCGYSQEELASKLGLSRQSVSKWERAEASPDTDNLIELARLYNVSLDDLLNPDVNLDEVINKADKNPNEGSDVNETFREDAECSNESSQNEEKDSKSKVNIGRDGIHIDDGDDSVHIDGKGIHIVENGQEKHFTGDDIKRKFKREEHLGDEIATAVIGTLIIIGYLLFGFLYPDHEFAWSVGWTAILLIPVVESIFKCARKHRVSRFAYPILITAVYCFVGIAYGLWHPLWVIFLTIPVFYGLASPFDKLLKRKYANEKEDDNVVIDVKGVESDD